MNQKHLEHVVRPVDSCLNSLSAIDDCLSNPCNNGGTCTDLKDDILCECQSGYSGKFCENENDECLSDPCYQGATCVDKVINTRPFTEK